MASAGRPFSTSGFIIRMLMTLFLVLAAYNPTGYSYYHWLISNHGGFVSKVMVGLLIVSINLMFLVMAIDALKLIGSTLVIINYIAVVWWLNTIGAIDFWQGSTMWMSLLIGLATMNAAGLSYSLWAARMSGLVHISKY